MLSAATTIPTDNLYKFKAISGLVVALFCFGFLAWDLRNTTDEVNLISVEQKSIMTAQTSLGEEIIALENAVNSENISAEDVATIKQKLLRIQEDRKAIDKNMSALEKRSVKLFNAVSRAIWFFLIVMGNLGIVISVRGFHQWQKKVQSPLDEILQLNLQKAREELSQSPSKSQEKI